MCVFEKALPRKFTTEDRVGAKFEANLQEYALICDSCDRGTGFETNELECAEGMGGVMRLVLVFLWGAFAAAGQEFLMN